MTDKTFEDYKKEAEACISNNNQEVDLCSLISGLQKTFPKKPEPRDHFCICYIYMKKSAFPMQPDDLQDWGKKIKQAFKHINDLDPKFRDGNRVYLLMMAEKVPLECDEIYRMSLKALSEVDDKYPHKKDLQSINYRAADKYYDELSNFAVNSKNFDSYDKNIKFYENKVFDVLLHTSPSSRYKKYTLFREKLDKLCRQSEWGRKSDIWPAKTKQRNKKVFNSLPLEIRMAMMRNMNRKKY